MQDDVATSCESRWFGRSMDGVCIRNLLNGLGTGRTEQERTDKYLRLPGNAEASIKLREGKLEVKVRTACGEFSSAEQSIEWASWAKWGLTLPAEDLTRDNSQWDLVTKSRTLWTYDLREGAPRLCAEPQWLEAGATLEYSSITVSDRTSWWSLALEAFGSAPHLQTLQVLYRGLPPTARQFLHKEAMLHYPEWLRSEAFRQVDA